jgi:hypothetical protein
MTEWTAGDVPGRGTFHCTTCEYRVSLNVLDEVPTCPRCYGTSFVRSSLFAALETALETEAHGLPQLRGPRVPGARVELRGRLRGPGAYLGYRRESGEYRTVHLRAGSTRIGRSEIAHVRFDDPTVSRRHALVVQQANGVHILDDRSLNGVFVNGERIEWRLLNDGDEIVIGRHRLDFIQLTDVSLGRSRSRSGDRALPIS